MIERFVLRFCPTHLKLQAQFEAQCAALRQAHWLIDRLGANKTDDPAPLPPPLRVDLRRKPRNWSETKLALAQAEEQNA